MSAVTCAEFDRWLDDGAGDRDADMLPHAATCPRCARALDAMEAIGVSFAGSGATAPAGFTDAVMRRVADLEAARVRLASQVTSLEPDALPWWASALRHPATVLATIVVGLVTWRTKELIAGGTAAVSWISGFAATVADHASRALAVPGTTSSGGDLLSTGLLVALVPVLTLGSLALGRRVARITSR